MLKTRPLEPEIDWWCFEDRYPISPADRAAILPLEKASACSLWDELVSADPNERHAMLLRPGHWIGQVVAAGPAWQEYWNHPERPDAVAAFLRSQVGWPEEVDVYFMWMREQAVRVSWGVFLRTWRNFLFDDEGPLLIRLQEPTFVLFSPTGQLGVGHRSSPEKHLAP
jgi:hypothetical protein